MLHSPTTATKYEAQDMDTEHSNFKPCTCNDTRARRKQRRRRSYWGACMCPSGLVSAMHLSNTSRTHFLPRFGHSI